MKTRKLSKIFIAFLISLSLLFMVIEKNHECSGDGCLICLFSTLIYIFTEVMLIATIAPIFIDKIYTLIIETLSPITVNSQYTTQKNNCASKNGMAFENASLVTEGVRIQ